MADKIEQERNIRTEAPEFFYRVDHFDLTPGWKAAGFFLTVSTDALRRLREVAVSAEEYQALSMKAIERVARAKVLPKTKRGLSGCRMSLVEHSGCPLSFSTDPVFGASLCGDPDKLGRITQADALEVLGPSLDYTPHNCDAPAQALALMILVQTWGEWAYGKLLVQAAKPNQP
ncbi:TPA: hypothetical protein QDB04_000140 [Burkholderia vietnamiensis]|nr:hypothetical protein [Burkholderia vietnamiensis]